MTKRILISLIFLNVLFSGTKTIAQNFTWMKGPNSIDQPGNYGPKGVAATTNNPGGRVLSSFWKDAAGNFWLFGGNGIDYIGNGGFLNDLWKYNPSNNQWTWVSGDNVFIQLGKYGTMGVPSTTNCPGARNGAASWIDGGGNLWLFGGFGYGSAPTMGPLNDLWKYNIANNEWTWVGGSDLTYGTAVYGALGIPSPANWPGSRSGSTSWRDGTGNVLLFGGNGVTTNSNSIGELNDVWTYDASVNEWTWLNGSNVQNQNGTYGIQGTSSSANTPGGRNQAMSWVDNSANFWLFGGYGFDDSTATVGLLNDLWRYNKNSNQWTWIKGSGTVTQTGTYGTMGSASPVNIPGSRAGGATWIDGVGNMWLFGGTGIGASQGTGQLHDMWNYNPVTNRFTWVKGGNGIDVNGVYGTMGLAAAANAPGGRSGTAHWIDATNNLWFFGGEGKGATGPSGKLSDLWTFKNCHINPVTITVSPNDSIVCKGETLILSASGSNNYTWSNGTFSSSIVLTPSANVAFTVYSSDPSGCVYSTTYTQAVLPCLGVYDNSNRSLVNTYPNPGNGEFTISGFVNNGKIIITTLTGQVVFESEITGNELLHTALPNGIYLYRLEETGMVHPTRKLIISRQ